MREYIVYDGKLNFSTSHLKEIELMGILFSKYYMLKIGLRVWQIFKKGGYKSKNIIRKV